MKWQSLMIVLNICLFLVSCTNSDIDNESIAEDNISPIDNSDTESVFRFIDDSVNDQYTYTLLPGTEEWKSYTDRNELSRDLEIPSELLSNLSTYGLVKTILDYPLLEDMYYYEDINDGLKHVRSNYNGLQELYTRDDLAINICAIYQEELLSIEASNFISNDLRNLIKRITHIEIILNQETVLEQLTEMEKSELVKLIEFALEVKDSSSYEEYSIQLRNKVN